jgi:hypothetical protein
MCYRLRALLILMTLGPPVLAGVWQFETDGWPLFLAIGLIAYFVFVLLVGIVLAWLIETTARLVAMLVRGK